jgi:ribosome recycling factor
MEQVKTIRRKTTKNNSSLLEQLEALRVGKADYQFKNNIVCNGYDQANAMLDRVIAIVKANG